MAAALTLGLTAACVPAARGPVAPAVSAGVRSVSLDGQALSVSVAPGPQGTALTHAGAVAVAGRQIAVTRVGAPLAQDEGAIAKRAAKEGCQAQGGRFNGAALGRYAGQGVWAFPGGCA
ncbi:MAG: hypothetical protein QM656_14500 [Paracoccaceae bacterium]